MNNACKKAQEITDEEWLALTDFSHGGQLHIGFDPYLQKKLQATAKLLKVPDMILVYAAVEEYCDRFALELLEEYQHRQANKGIQPANDPIIDVVQ